MPKPEIWVASKPAASMVLALKASWQPGTATARRSMIAFLRTTLFFVVVADIFPSSPAHSRFGQHPKCPDVTLASRIS